MGAVLAKFRKVKTTEQVLEVIEEKIQTIEKYSRNTQDQQKRFVGNFLTISIGVYVLAFITFYFVYFPPTWMKRIIYSVPLLLFPFVIILLRKLFTWFFQRTINKNSKKLTDLRAEKKQVLQKVMDNETYKVAVKLLARFGEKSSAAKLAFPPSTPSTHLNKSTRSFGSINTPSTNVAISGLRPLNTSIGAVESSLSLGAAATVNSIRPSTPRQLPASISQGQVANTLRTTVHSNELRRRTPFPIINQNDKGVFERMVDMLIGDGPQDRFAMICKECYGHNGMALKEEFYYATFRCAYCNALNPSRKSRPIGPRLPEQSSFVSADLRSCSSESSSSNDSDSDDTKITARRSVQPTELIEPMNPSKNVSDLTNASSMEPNMSPITKLSNELHKKISITTMADEPDQDESESAEPGAKDE